MKSSSIPSKNTLAENFSVQAAPLAKTGSLLLSDVDLGINALAYLAQHLIVLLDPADIVVNTPSLSQA
jgi:hypothetical protein